VINTVNTMHCRCAIQSCHMKRSCVRRLFRKVSVKVTLHAKESYHHVQQMTKFEYVDQLIIKDYIKFSINTLLLHTSACYSFIHCTAYDT